MSFLPINRMWDRVEIAKQDSDTSLHLSLLYCSEMIAKIAVLGMIAGIENDRDRHRYTQMYKLVRADGIGDWASVLEDVLTGPTSQYLRDQIREEQKELTMMTSQGHWIFESVTLLHKCLEKVDPNTEKLPTKIDLRRWFRLLATFRNKTRGHGAPLSEIYGSICGDFERSIKLFSDNFRLFARPWAYLYRNLSGKYRVTKWTQLASKFDILKTKAVELEIPDGVYIFLDEPVLVELIYSDVDALDFLIPNGSFNEKSFETISYITNSRKSIDSKPYLLPVMPLPDSETQGMGNLEIQGNIFGNLPPVQSGYIKREGLENKLSALIRDDRHPIITLVGRGGIGKTWLTLTVLHEITQEDIYTAMIWFSARDIDLLPQGAKLVRPQILNERDIAIEFNRLVNPTTEMKKQEALEYFSKVMTKSEFGPILFVFDNFETLRSPSELYKWIDSCIRPPNKVIITTRFREFKGDYPLDVYGMDEKESEKLIELTAKSLGISDLLTDAYRNDLFKESMGHPYVMKILLGEVAKAGKILKVERITATLENILDALFERTFATLSPAAKRLFLTLCMWRSSVPLLAIQAVLLRPSNERIDVDSAVEELVRSSFIETSESSLDGQLFVTVPLVATVFGKRKFVTTPIKSAIESDLQLLYEFGAAQQSDIKQGVKPRIQRLFKNVATRISSGKEPLEEYLPILEFVSSKYPPGWLLLAELYQELDAFKDLEKAKESTRRYIEASSEDLELLEKAWKSLAVLSQITSDTVGEIQALVELSQLQDIDISVVSDAVNRVNALFAENYLVLDSEEKRIISERLAEVMEKRISEGDATDCSRLAWLFLRLNQRDKAKNIVGIGLGIDPDNVYCINLSRQLQNPY